MVNAYINYISTAVPDYDIHNTFINFATSRIENVRMRTLFKRMAERSQIDHRYSVLKSSTNNHQLDAEDFYNLENFPYTQKRMDMYKKEAFKLAKKTLDKLEFQPQEITHIIITSCTGFYSPGLDLEIISHYDMPSEIERNYIGFMGCYAAINGLKMAHHIIRSKQDAKVLIINIELSTLHLQKTDNLERLLTYLIFADGCAASIVSSDPIGIRIDSFYSNVISNSSPHITWNIGDQGFDMVLSGEVPNLVNAFLKNNLNLVLRDNKKEDIHLWAIHPGGRSIIDAVQKSLNLKDAEVQGSRDVLKNYGNMSSATIMFVLDKLMKSSKEKGKGCAMAFGPGVMLESMLFNIEK